MKKELLETFIKRYTLGGIIEKAKWKYIATDKILHTRAVADNRSFVVDVIMNNFFDLGNDDAILCIGNTSKIKSLMSPFVKEDIKLELNKKTDQILGFTLSDDDCESYCSCADPSSMDPVPKFLQDIPDYQVIIPLTNEFLEKFLKSQSALKDVDSFSVGMNKKGIFEIVIGYTTANSNRIRLIPVTDSIKNKLNNVLSFPAKNITAVLKANSDIENGTISINDAGVARIYFKNDKYTATYYQFCNKKS
jgi:hypothetical protein